MAQSFGLYQLENLLRSQAKFIMVALTSAESAVPVHPLLKPHLVTDPESAPTKIQARMSESQYPAWWPVVLISDDGHRDAKVAAALATLGLINVYSYAGGWNLLRQEST